MRQKFEIFKDRELLKEIPKQIGVYIIYSKDDEVLYVGKAKSLRDRLRSYVYGRELDFFKQSLVREAFGVEVIAVENELEALLLESNLIKQYRPPYNVVLRDDKSYPYLRISYSEKFPRLSIARRVKQKGDFYFGPITPVDRLKNLLKLLKSTFKIAQKNDSQCQGSKSACIYYQMGKCLAPCIGNVSRDEYLKVIDEIRSILTNPKRIKKQLERELKELSEKLEFEKAIKVRDRLKAIELLENSQSVSEVNEEFSDVIAVESEKNLCCVYLMSVRFSNIVGSRSFFFYDTTSKDELLESFFIQYYLSMNQVIPDVIITEPLSSMSTLKQALSLTKSVQIVVPRRGKRKRLLELAKKNAKLNLSLHLSRFQGDIEIFEKLRELTSLNKLPITIDVADVSHIGFESIVGGVVRYTLGGFDKSMYRRFNLEHKYEFDAMKEMLSRHKRLLLNSSNRVADIVVVDGGLIQVKAAKEVFGQDQAVLGISKEKTDKRAVRSKGDVEDKIYNETGEISVDRDVLQFLQRLRDEAHRFAIEFHRKKRKEYVLSSALDRVEFIGPKRKKALFEKFGTLDNIKKASIEEIASVKGISLKIASIIKERINEMD